MDSEKPHWQAQLPVAHNYDRNERGRRCEREPAHGLGKCLRAMARRGRRLPDQGISVPSGVARILAGARDVTDFRPSMNGVGGACASRRMVWGSV